MPAGPSIVPSPTRVSHIRRRAGARLAIAGLAFALAACASGGASGETAATTSMAPEQRRETLMIEGALLQYFPSAGTRPTEDEVMVPVARAWQVLPEVYEQLGLKMNEIIGAQRQIGTGLLKVQGRVGRMSMSRIIDCGHTSGIANADAYSVNLMVRTQVLPTKDSTATMVRTILLASGRQAATSGGGTVSCPSSGELERQIAKLVGQRAAAKSEQAK